MDRQRRLGSGPRFGSDACILRRTCLGSGERFGRVSQASHVETLIRRYGQANRLLENAEAEARHASQGLSTWFDSDGMPFDHGHLPWSNQSWRH